MPTPRNIISPHRRSHRGKQKQTIYDHIARCNDCMDALQAVFDAPTEEELKQENVPKQVLEKANMIPKMYPREK